jgi:hypothetical protein
MNTRADSPFNFSTYGLIHAITNNTRMIVLAMDFFLDESVTCSLSLTKWGYFAKRCSAVGTSTTPATLDIETRFRARARMTDKGKR